MNRNHYSQPLSGLVAAYIVNSFNLQSYGHHAFSVIAPVLWNTNPIAIRCSANVDIFKSRLKVRHIFLKLRISNFNLHIYISFVV